MDDFTIYAVSIALILVFGIYAAISAVSPWGIDLKLSDDQLKAVSKRAADALEKLSIGCLLYWVFQEKPIGLLLAVFCIGISFIITIKDTKK